MTDHDPARFAPGFAEARATMDAAEPFAPGPIASQDAPERGGSPAAPEGSGGVNLPPKPPPQDTEMLEWARLPKNDLGNAQRLLRWRGADLMYVPGKGWYAWTGQFWSPDDGERLARLAAQSVPDLIHQEAEALLENPRQGEDVEKLQKRAEGHRKWAIGTGNSNRMAAMLREAEPRVQRRIEEIDARPALLCVENGVLELGSDHAEADGGVRLRRHSRGDLLSRMMPVKYDRAATAPLFLAFLEQVMPDPQKRLFLQRYCGYALTGDVGEQCLLLNYGTGANGKSTFMDLLRQLFGALAMAMDFSSLEHNDNKRGGDATPDLIDLPGKRLVMASEPKPGVKLSEGLIKSLTGGDPIKARQLNQPFIEFYPQFKLMLAFNTKPTITGTDNGIWRRLLLLDWSVTIPKDRRDKHLKEKLMAEGPGILNWLLDGWRLWRDNGLSPPESVAAATSAWREESDRMGAFIEACCQMGPSFRVGASTLYKTYSKWCTQNAVDATSQTMFGKLFPERAAEFGVSKSKTAGIISYAGVDVKSEWLSDPQGE